MNVQSLPFALVTAEPIDLVLLHTAVVTSEHGAIVAFEGVVRDHDHERSVTELEYQAHPEAQAFLQRTLLST
jgi:molybdopterin synthase catalytic subunit